MKKLNNISNIIFYNVLLFFVLIFFIELTLYSIRVLVLDKPSIGFLYNSNFQEIDGCQDMISHPFYGYVHNNNSDCEIKGGFKKGPFVYYDGYDSNRESIIVFGGSTTDGYYNHVSNGYTWPYYLQKLINERKLNINVINAGTGGYNSDQELLKLIIDAKKIKSKIIHVICLNGINDVENYKALPEIIKNKMPYFDYNIIKMFDKKIYLDQSISNINFLPNIIYLFKYLKDYNTNIKSDFFISSFDKNYSINKGSDNWYFNVKLMKKVSELINAKFKVFIQPTMGVNGQVPKEKKTKDFKIYSDQMTPEYYTLINEHYEALKSYCSQIDFCEDISDIAPPIGNNYSDIRHHNEYGNKILADEIFNRIFQN